jgi:hypothetical protein
MARFARNSTQHESPPDKKKEEAADVGCTPISTIPSIRILTMEIVRLHRVIRGELDPA